MSYVDGFLLIVPRKNLKAYTSMAKVARRVWMDHGALAYRECVGDDLDPPCGVPFAKLAKAKRGELVFFSYIRYKSRAHRDKVNAAVMKDKRLAAAMNMKSMPFDPKRMAYGGFKGLVEA